MRLFLIRKICDKCENKIASTAKEFVATEIKSYHGNLPDGAMDHH